MEFHLWTLFALAIIVASVSPGPNVLIVVVNTLKHGTRGAVFTILGNLTCLFGFAVLTSIGVGAAIATAPLVYTLMKVAGGLYLAWLGFKMIRASFGPQQAMEIAENAVSKERVSALSLFVQAFLVSASNPKSILFLTAVFPQFLITNQPVLPQFGIMFATIIVLVCTIHSVYGMLAVSLSHRPVTARMRRWMSRVTGTTFIGLGAGVALAK